MNHIYAVHCTEVAKKRRREVIVEDIKFLRSFEMKYGQNSFIDEKIHDNVKKLHKLWFGPKLSDNTSKQ